MIADVGVSPNICWVGNTDTEPISRYFQIPILIPTSVLQIPKIPN